MRRQRGRGAGWRGGAGAGWERALDLRRRSPRHSGRGAWGKWPASGTVPHPQRRCHTWSHSSWWSGRGYQCKTPGLFSVERKDNKWEVQGHRAYLKGKRHPVPPPLPHTLSSWPYVSATLAAICNVIGRDETSEDQFFLTFNTICAQSLRSLPWVSLFRVLLKKWGFCWTKLWCYIPRTVNTSTTKGIIRICFSD